VVARIPRATRAACGAAVPMISGRGLGHTGGTLDKLESIPGFRTDIALDDFVSILERERFAMIGQTPEIAPLDRRLYDLRSVTGTVSSIPLIATSIMSKKLAEGLTGLVLDVKAGSGAFLPGIDHALELARTMVTLGERAGVETVALVTAMDRPLGRAIGNALEVAELAVRYRHDGIVGFDIAGAEAGHPPTRHIAAFQYLQRANFHFTIHAGEGFGLPSIWEAVQYCGTERLGHGVRIVEDIEVDADDPEAPPRLGPLAAYVRDRRIPLELCPSSNVHTALAPSIAEHPIDLLRRLRFRVTINTDNRLMSDTCLSKEMQLCAEAFGWTMADLRWLTINAMKSSFIPFDERLALIDDVIKPGYATLGAR